jgi:putative transposase
LFLDGKEFHDFTLIVALGLDDEGRKHVLGLWSGATENAEVCGALLDDLIERGLSRDHPYLFVLDGAKALRKAVIQRFGSRALIQRCRVHKKRNLQKYLPKKYHGMLSMKLKVAWEMTDYTQARQELRKVQPWLASINQAAARSLEEGFEETLTVNRLQRPSQLPRLLSSTNIIESCFSLTGGPLPQRQTLAECEYGLALGRHGLAGGGETFSSCPRLSGVASVDQCVRQCR